MLPESQDSIYKANSNYNFLDKLSDIKKPMNHRRSHCPKRCRVLKDVGQWKNTRTTDSHIGCLVTGLQRKDTCCRTDIKERRVLFN